MQDCLEYVFFHETIAAQFKQLLQQHQLPFSESTEAVTGARVVALPESTVSGELWDLLDNQYDQLHEQEQALLESGMLDATDKSVAGIYIQLANGESTIASVAPDVMNRLLTVISMDELNQFVEAIVRSVEQPQQASLCQL